MQDLLRQWWMGYPKNHRRVQARSHEAFQTASAPGESSSEYFDSSSPVEDMRKRLRELRAPVWGTKTQIWRRLLEREVIERPHLDDQTLLDRRRDLENAIDPTVPRTLK